MVNSKHAFWQALVFTIVIFLIGALMGFFLENSRADKIQLELMNSEINVLDEQLRNKIVEDFNLSCEHAVKSTFEFADKIYWDAIKLEKYDSTSKFTETLKEIHKRYDLLRVILWSESIRLKETCGADFHTIIYLFDYDSDNVNVKSEQLAFSRLLFDIKKNYPDKIILIPIAANLDLDSVNLIMTAYNITHRPAVIADESSVITEILNYRELENIIFKSNKR